MSHGSYNTINTMRDLKIIVDISFHSENFRLDCYSWLINFGELLNLCRYS